MPLDKQLYQNYYKAMREWNEAELRDRVRNLTELSPLEAWNRYNALWIFAMKFTPSPDERQQRQKIESLNRYYERVQKLEEWRRQNGRIA